MQRSRLWLRLPLLRRALVIGVKSLWLHRMRSSLTILGIVFGVSSVITMLAVGEGAGFEAQEQIRRQGSQSIIIRSVKVPKEATTERDIDVEQYGLTYLDLRRIQNTIPTVDIVLPSRLVRRRVWNGVNRTECEVVGTLPTYPKIRGHQVAAGRFFTQRELGMGAGVCVLGGEVLNDLFPREAAINQSVRIGDDFYHVIGVMEKGGLGPARRGSAQGDSGTQAASSPSVYIPLTTARNRFGEAVVERTSGTIGIERVELHEIVVRVKKIDDVVETSLIIEDLLERFHKEKDFTITVPLSLLQAAQETKRIFNIVLGSIAGISLLVGGIGIMNIMLATVTERTREIGIRRALGAKRRDIVIQYLIEALLLSAFGGTIGVVLGFVLPEFISRFANVMTIVTPWSALIAFSISFCVGIVFGLYPALRAADMDPVEALRHE